MCRVIDRTFSIACFITTNMDCSYCSSRHAHIHYLMSYVNLMHDCQMAGHFLSFSTSINKK